MLFLAIGMLTGCKKYPIPSTPANGVKLLLIKKIYRMFFSKSSGSCGSGNLIILKGVFIRDVIPTPMIKKAISIIEIAP
jgi:hypothetical protein